MLILVGFVGFHALTSSAQFKTPEHEAVTSVATILEPTNVPTMHVSAWGIFDIQTGKIIAGNQIDTVKPIASITKLFTATAVLESKKKYVSFTIMPSDVAVEGDAGKLKAGNSVTPYLLLYPLLLESSNDAAEAIRRFLGDTFENTRKKIIDDAVISNTVLVDASGLSSKNVSTVRDLAQFFSYIYVIDPHILDITQLYTYVGSDTGYINNNPGRKFKSFIGGKQGHTDEAQYTFLGGFKSPKTNTEIGIVILGSSNIREDINTLLSTYDMQETI